MNKIIKKIKEFKKRWDVIDDSSYEEEFNKFKRRVLNIFSDIDSHITEEGISQFCQILGTVEKWEYQEFGDKKWSKNIVDALIQENDEKKFYFLLQIIFYLPIRTAQSYSREVLYSKDLLYEKLKEAIGLSKVNLAITKVKEEVVLYPRGEKELDKKLVNEVLCFLDGKSQKHFIDALKLYEKGTPEDAIKSAEGLRRSLEEFLRSKLQNQQGLDKNIQELQKRLKTDSRDPTIKNIIFQVFSYLDLYFNENSKHKDGDIDEPENEYLIYQTGALMRYIQNALK